MKSLLTQLLAHTSTTAAAAAGRGGGLDGDRDKEAKIAEMQGKPTTPLRPPLRPYDTF